MELDLLNPTDKPALLGMSNADSLAACKAVLTTLGYKVHSPENHSEFLTRFGQVQYQVVIMDETFGKLDSGPSPTLQAIQSMPMNQRRHSVFVLLGDSFKTLDSLQALRQSVHAVVNRADIGNLELIVRKIVLENDLFYATYRESQSRIAQGR
jgi:hypothetical protein